MWNIYFNPVVLGPNYSDQGYAKKKLLIIFKKSFIKWAKIFKSESSKIWGRQL